jgi:Recombination endonuclease VII
VTPTSYHQNKFVTIGPSKLPPSAEMRYDGGMIEGETHFGRGHKRDLCPKCGAPRHVKTLQSGNTPGRVMRHCYECRKIRQRARKYGLTFEQLLALYAKGQCDICNRKIPITGRGLTAIDHKGEKVRGVLCGNCNLLLGHARDEVEVLQRAIQYLRRAEDL